MTMGIAAVACLKNRVDTGPAETITSTLRRTSSAASAGRRSGFPSAYRHSMTMLFPSTYPRSRRPCRNASLRAGLVVGKLATRYPIRGTFVGCCAAADAQSARSMAQRVRTVIFLFMFFSALSTRHSTLDTRPFSLDQSSRPGEHLRWNRHADLLRCLEVDHELKLGRLLHRQIGGLGALEDSVHEICDATVA